MILYSDKDDHYSHRVRIVLAEKDIACEIRETTNEEAPDEVLAMNPYHTLPILADRDLGLYDAGVMLEYLDERFPHPPLLPVYPVSRANIRLYIKRIERDWCLLFDRLLERNLKKLEAKKAKQKLRALILSCAPIFKEKPFFMSDDFSLVDCCIAPILWRLPLVDIEIPKDLKNRPIHDYMKRVFTKPCFLDSLSEQEREVHSL